MTRSFLLVALALLTASVAKAQSGSEEARFLFGGDVFHVGQVVLHDTVGADDLFLAGQRLRVDAPVTGTILAAGQTVTLGGDAGGDVYVAGQEITVTGAVTGDVTAAGQDLRLEGAIGGDLRAGGSRLELRAPVAGYAILGAEDLVLDAIVAGDVALAAESAEFGPGARIDGVLHLYEDDPGRIAVPATVASQDRIVRHELEEWDHGGMPAGMPTVRGLIARFLGGVAMVALLAALIAALVPGRLAEMRRGILEAPFRTLGAGFLAQSALVGSVFVVAITVIGLILVPAILLLSGITVLAGYVVGAYAFGVGLILLIGRDEPDSLAERAIAAGIGAFAAGVVALIPFLGWIFVVALALTGLGAIVLSILGRRGIAAA